MRFRALVQRIPRALLFVIRRAPSAFTYVDRLFAFRLRYPDTQNTPPAGFEPVRLQLVALEPRLVPDARPLPLPVIYAGAGTGMAPIVRAYDAETGALNFETTVYGASVTGGVRVAAGDFTGDGYPDVLVAPAPGGAPLLRVLDGTTGTPVAGPLGGFMAFEPTFLGGVSVAAADVDGDGTPDVVAAATRGSGPEVLVFSGANGRVVAHFFVTGSDFAGGITVATADLTGDGLAEIAVGAGPGAAPRVNVYNPLTGTIIDGPLGSFLAFDSGFAGGVNVGSDAMAGDVDGDGTPDLAVGTGPGITARVRVFSGADGSTLLDLTPFGSGVTNGVRVGLSYVTDDQYADVVAGTGPGVTSTIRVLDGQTGLQLAGVLGEYTPFGAATGGVNIGASNDPPVPLVPLGPPPPPPPAAAIGDHVWYDADADGVEDGGEYGAAGVTVTLTGGGLTAARTEVTDYAGDYDFTGLAAGTYTLDFTAPPGYGFSTPSGGEETVSVTAGEDYDTADAGLIPPPILDGRVLITIKGQGYSGVVAEVEGTQWAAGDLSATIQWGDGTSSSGTLTTSSGTVSVSGSHTYTHEGMYALAVRVAAPGVSGVYNYAADLADVLAPTDHRGLERVATATATGSSTLGEVVSLTTGGGFAAFATGSGTYTLSESGTEPGDSFDLTRVGGFGFTLAESGSDFPQPDSTLTVTVSESSTKTVADAAPDRNGTATEYGSLGYTLSQTGSGADYTWTQSGTSSSTRSETETVSDGTYTATDTRSSTTTTTGENDAPGSTFALSGSGTETASRTESGFHGAESYTRERTATGSVTLTESGGFGDYSFARTEGHSGAFTLSETTSNPGGTGTASGTGTYSDALTGSGTDPGGTVGYTATGTESYGGTGDSTRTGAVTTSAVVRSSTDTVTTTGSEATGAFTLVHAMTNGTTTTATEVNQGVTSSQTATTSASSTQTETGSTGAGTYALSGTSGSSVTTTGSGINQSETDGWSSSQSRSATTTQSGDRLTGSYTLSETATTTGSSAGNSTQGSTQTAGGVTGRHSLGETDTATESRTATIGRSGNLVSGSYSLHETSSSTATETDTSTEDTNATGTLGSTNDDDATATDRETVTGSMTLDRTGNALSGTYSLHQVSSSGGTGSDTSTESSGWLPGDGEDDESVATDRSTTSQSSGSTLDRTGNEVSGSYSQHQVSSSTATVYGTATTALTDIAADASENDDLSVELTTAYQISSSTADRTGNEASGDYSEHVVASNSASQFAAGSDHQTDNLADGEDDDNVATNTSSAYQVSGSTVDRTGNDVSGSYSEHVVSSTSGSSSATSTDTASADLADGSDTGDLDVERERNYQTSGSTIDRTGNRISGSYSEHQQSSSTATVFGTGTDTSNEDMISGDEYDDVRTNLSTAYQTSGWTLDRTGNSFSGSYSEHEVNSTTDTVYGASTDTATDDLRDGSEDNSVDVELQTSYQVSSSTIDRTGNTVSGAYSETQTSSDSVSAFATSTDTATASPIDGSLKHDLASHFSSQFETGGSTVNRSGNWLTGAYSLHETSSSTGTNFASDTDSSTDDLADGSTDSSTESDSSTNSDTGSSTVSSSGNNVTGEYSETEIASDTGSGTDGSSHGLAEHLSGGGGDRLDAGTETGSNNQTSGSTTTRTGSAVTGLFSIHEVSSSTSTMLSTSTSTPTEELTGESEQDELDVELSSAYETSGSTRDESGNEATGDYTEHETDTNSGASSQGTTDTVVVGGVTTVQGDTNVSSESGTGSTTRTGNSISGAYSVFETGSSDPTEADVSTDQGLSDTGTTTAHNTWTLSESGNSITGAYTIVNTSTNDSTAPMSGTDARGTYAGTQTNHDTSTDTETGNNIAGNHTDVVTGSDDSTLTVAGGDGSTSYDRTQISAGSSTVTSTWNDNTNLSTRVAVSTRSATVAETGSSPTTDYTLSEVDGSTATDTETADNLSGVSTVTHVASSTSSLHEEANEGTAGEYTIDKTTGSTGDTTRIADSQTGDYTLSGVTGMTSTSIESNTHGSFAALFTEILTDDTTISEDGNNQAGQYELTETGTRSANFVDDGTDPHGSFHVTEGSSGTFDRTTTGDSNTGATVSEETSDTAYNVTEVVTGTSTFTMTESGTDSMTAIETNNTVTGDYSRTETGTDLFTLGESGTLSGAFSDTVTGTDVYASTESGNHNQQTYDRTTTGGGAWVRTASGGTLGSTSGTNGYTLTESGDQAAGHFSQSEAGTDRYGLVEKFDDVSNTGSGSTPGNVTFHSHGLAFRDPTGSAQDQPPKLKDVPPLYPELPVPPAKYTIHEIKNELRNIPAAKPYLDMAREDLVRFKRGYTIPKYLPRGVGPGNYNYQRSNPVIELELDCINDLKSGASTLLFELLRHKYADKQIALDGKAMRGEISRADYIKQSEKDAYDLMIEHHNVMKTTADKDGRTDPRLDEYAILQKIYPTFEKKWADPNDGEKGGHARAIGENYDRLRKIGQATLPSVPAGSEKIAPAPRMK